MKPDLISLFLILDGHVMATIPLFPADIADIKAKLRTCSRKEAKAFAKVMVPAMVEESDDVHRLKDEFLKQPA